VSDYLLDDNPVRSAPLASVVRPSSLPRTDWFTILLHWSGAIAMVLSLVTGLRIAADALDAVIPKWLAPTLPQGDMWDVHLYSGLTFFFTMTAYVVYLRTGELFSRNSLKKLRLLVLPTAAKMKWNALNIALHWLLYGLIIIMCLTGIAMYLGYGAWIIKIHRASAILSLGYIVAHVIAHFMYGGWRQLLRIFLPHRLKVAGQATAKPACVALAISIPVTAALAGLDWASSAVLIANRVATAPDPAKLLDDPIWSVARPVFVHTAQGANLGGTGESLVEIRAVHDAEKIYFAFRWEDPTRSIARLPLIKRADGWHMLDDKADVMDVVGLYEDKFALIFTKSTAFGDGGIAHLGPKPLADKPAPMNGRGLHYTTDGSTIEMWQWKSTRGGLVGGMDHQFIGPPREPTPGEAAGRDRYQAGYWNYSGAAPYVYNYVSEPPGGYHGPIGLKYLPKNLAATQQAMGRPVTEPDVNMDEQQRYWMFEEETIPYSKEADAEIPVGTVVPGIVLKNHGLYSGERGAIKATAKWADGHWTLIASRTLKKTGQYDEEFAPGNDLNLYVAVYDHTQTRHTRHQRPVQLSVR
jgi:cytochrome b subunit of formate dehydrogenase